MKAILIASGLLASQAGDHAPPPIEADAGRLVVATTAQLYPIVEKTAIELERERPALKVSILSVGSDVAMAELYTRRADLAVIGRAATDPEIKAFQWIFQYPPQRWPVLRGSLAAPGHSPSIRVLVNAANPIRRLSLEQLERAYRAEQPISWRDLGVTGRFGLRAVHPLMPDSEQGTGRFIREALFRGSTLFAWQRVQEIAEPMHRGGKDDSIGRRIAAAVARDPQALALVPANPVPGSRAVPLDCATVKPASPCDKDGALERSIYAYSDRGLRSQARAFLNILSTGGDRARVDPAPYRQLPASEVRALLDRLELENPIIP